MSERLRRAAGSPFAWALAAVAIRVALALPGLDDPQRLLNPDSRAYLRYAGQLLPMLRADGPDATALSTLLTPGYPLWLALLRALGLGVFGIAVAQAALAGGAVLLTARLARIVGAPPAPAAALLALDPVSAISSGFVLTESLFTPLVVGGTLALAHYRSTPSMRAAAATGGLFGLASLVRPIVVLLPVVLLPLAVAGIRASRRQRAALAAVMLTCFAALPAAWAVRNLEVIGVPTLATVDAASLLELRAADAMARERPGSTSRWAARLRESAANRAGDGGLGATYRAQRSVAIQALLDHPRGAALSAIAGFGRLTLGLGRADLRGRVGPVAGLLMLGLGALMLAVLLVGSAAAVWHRRWTALLAPGVVGGYLALVSSGPEAYARFRVPVVPLLAVIAAAGLATLGRHRLAGDRT